MVWGIDSDTLYCFQESDDRMRSLLSKMAESEKANRDIMAMNAELKTMLKDLEEKSSKIARLAKEKVHKYVDQNKVNIKCNGT